MLAKTQVQTDDANKSQHAHTHTHTILPPVWTSTDDYLDPIFENVDELDTKSFSFFFFLAQISQKLVSYFINTEDDPTVQAVAHTQVHQSQEFQHRENYCD